MAIFAVHTDGKNRKVASRFTEHTDGKTHKVTSRWAVDASGIIRKIWSSLVTKLVPYTNVTFGASVSSSYTTNLIIGSSSTGASSYFKHYTTRNTPGLSYITVDWAGVGKHKVEFDLSIATFSAGRGIAGITIYNPSSYTSVSDFESILQKAYKTTTHVSEEINSSRFYIAVHATGGGSILKTVTITIQNIYIDGELITFPYHKWGN